MVDILILPHAMGLTHISRSYLICQELQSLGYDVKLAYSGKYEDLIKDNTRVNGIINDYGDQDYVRSIEYLKTEPGKFPWGGTDRLERIVEDEVSVIQRLNPKIVIGDTKLSLFISSKLTSTPYISITNANMTPHYKKLPLYSYFKAKKDIKTYNSVLKRFNIKRDVNNFYEIFIGDLNLMVDLPDFKPIKKLPKKFKYVGPVLWSSDEMPPWSNEIKNKNKRNAYVSLGATGNPFILEIILQGLIKSGYRTIVSMGGLFDKIESDNPNIFTTKLISQQILKHCDLTVCHGGDAVIYHSLIHNCPIIGIPFNPDQFDNTNQLIKLKLGVGLYYNCLKPEDIIDSIKFLLSNHEYKENIKIFSEKLKKVNGEKTAAVLIKNYLEDLWEKKLLI